MKVPVLPTPALQWTCRIIINFVTVWSLMYLFILWKWRHRWWPRHDMTRWRQMTVGENTAGVCTNQYGTWGGLQFLSLQNHIHQHPEKAQLGWISSEDNIHVSWQCLIVDEIGFLAVMQHFVIFSPSPRHRAKIVAPNRYYMIKHQRTAISSNQQ